MRPCARAREVTEAIEAYRFNDAAGVDLSLRLERLLRLVSRTRQAGADGRGRRREGRDPRDGGVGARRNPQAAASVHAVHYRRTLGGDGRARRGSAGADAVAGQIAGTDRRTTGPDIDHKPERSADAAGTVCARCSPISAIPRPRPRSAGWSISSPPIRSVRAEMNIPPATLTPLVLAAASAETKAARATLERRGQAPCAARRHFLRRRCAGRRGAVAGARRGRGLPLKGVIDLSAEKARLDKEIAKADADIKRVDAKLATRNLSPTRPEEIVEEEKEKREAARSAQGEDPRSAGAAQERGSEETVARTAIAVHG